MTKTNLQKFICLVLCLFMALSTLAACSQGGDSKKPKTSSKDSDTTSDSADNNSVFDGLDDDEFTSDGDEDLDDSSEDDTTPIDPISEVDFSELNVYNGRAPLSKDYKGVSASVYHAYGFMKDDQTGRVYNDKMMDLELSRLEQSNIRYCRTRYTTYWAWNAQKDGFDFNSNRFNYFADYCKELQRRNMNVMMQIGWHFEYVVSNGLNSSINEVKYLLGNGADKYGETATYGSCIATEHKRTGSGKLREGDIRCGFGDADITSSYNRVGVAALRYANFYVESIKRLKAQGIHNITHLLYFTEPSYTSDKLPEGTVAQEYLFICKTIANVIRKSGVAGEIKHVGPNQGSINHGNGLLRYIVTRDPDLFDVYTAHLYPSAPLDTQDVYYDNIYPVFKSYTASLREKGIWNSKEFWVDEFFCVAENAKLGQGSGWCSLQTVVGAIAAQQEGINNISLWQIFDQLWTDQTNTGDEFNNGIHVCGTCPSLFVSSMPRASYYPISLFSRYNGYKNGKSYLTSTGTGVDTMDVYIGATQLEDGNWTVTIVNTTTEEKAIKVNFDKAIGKTMYRHVENVATRVPTTAARLADADRTFTNVQNKFMDVVPGSSVIIYTSVKG